MKLIQITCLAGLLWLGGCTTVPVDINAAAKNPAASTVQPPAAHQPLYPEGPLQPIASARSGSQSVASTAAPADMWDRIRRGFAMPDLEGDLVRDREQYYATRPDYMQRMTERSSKYLFHIVEELERRNMPTELALLPYIESAFNPQAVSVAKAAGMWQFMPATGTDFQLRQNVFRDDRRDVLASTRAALDYLQKLHGMFGDWHLALAAYNWGEGSVGRAIAKNQKLGLGTSYTDLNMPAETRLYVPKLQAVKNIVARPEAFNAQLPLIENHPYFQSVNITRDIDVELAAKLADVRMEDFKALNPSMRQPVILAAGTPQILLPWDNAKVFQRNLEAHTKGQYASWTAWTVPTNMTVAAIAQRVGMSEADLRSVNQIPPRMLVKATSVLVVPRSAKMQDDVSGHMADHGHLAFEPEIVTRRTLVKAGKGDTVISMARRYRLSAPQVADWNDVKTSAGFKKGQQVVMFLPVSVRGSGHSPAKAPAVRSDNKNNSKNSRNGRAVSATASTSIRKSASTPLARAVGLQRNKASVKSKTR